MKRSLIFSVAALGIALPAVTHVVDAAGPQPSRPGPSVVASVKGSPDVLVREGGHSLAQAPAGQS